MFKVRNIHSVTHFARNTRDHIERLQNSGEPEILTVNGEAALVVQDADAYERLLELVDYVDTVRTLRERLATLENGKGGRPMRQVIQELAAGAGIDLQRK